MILEQAEIGKVRSPEIGTILAPTEWLYLNLSMTWRRMTRTVCHQISWELSEIIFVCQSLNLRNFWTKSELSSLVKILWWEPAYLLKNGLWSVHCSSVLVYSSWCDCQTVNYCIILLDNPKISSNGNVDECSALWVGSVNCGYFSNNSGNMWCHSSSFEGRLPHCSCYSRRVGGHFKCSGTYLELPQCSR